MVKQKIKSGFKLGRKGADTWIDVSVPSSVYEEYLKQGFMEDPYWRDNEDKALLFMNYDYEYRTSFYPEEELFFTDKIQLQLDGIDTLSDIYFNGIHLGSTDNMHRIWKFNVDHYLKKGEENELSIVLHSPLSYIKKAYENCECDGSPECTLGFPHLRKSHCMFGWDWGPRLPDMGIFREISLIGVEKARFAGVYITQIHKEGKVTLQIQTDIDRVDILERETLSYEVNIISPNGEKIYECCSPKSITIENPMLWWPNGYGEQHLYQIEVVLKENDTILDQWNRRIGLRTMTMNTSKDEFGNNFAHEVNGVKVFAMGADYIPEDCILNRITKERTRNLLEQCIEANFNVIRVWGGGFYPHDYFYDICDELGLVVWQDFMFACAVYDLNEKFEENIQKEIIDNVKRIRHHACLGLWCGNNEMELFLSKNQWIKKKKQKADYIIMNEYMIPKLLKQYDPAAFYWPSSPSSGGSFDAPNDEARGDAHYWDVWHGGVPFTSYRKYYFRYLSEFGFQSFPSIKTIESFTLEEDRNVFSYIMEKHQRNDAANGKILHYLSQMYLYPSGFELLVYASQLLQAESIKYGVEHFRRNRGRCMGAVYWQLNDCWPAASWSSIDYLGRWKALHYYAKRFFAPVLLSCEEEGTLTQEINVNAQERNIRKSAVLSVSNETMNMQKVVVKWFLRQNDSTILQRGEFRENIEPLSSYSFKRLEFPNADLRKDYISYELWQDDTMISDGITLFEVPKHYNFLNPNLSVFEEDGYIVVTAMEMAKGVEIGNRDGDLILSDNFFDMKKGMKKIARKKGNTKGLWVRSVYDIQ